MIRTTVCDSSDWAAELRPAWTALVEESPEATPFQTWEWQSTWWRHYGQGKRPHVALFWEGEELVGLMPMVRATGPWRTVRAMGGGPSDYLHPLARSGSEHAVAGALIEHVTALPGIDLIDLHQVRQDRALAGALPASYVLEQARCLVLDLPETYGEFLAGLSKSLRYDVRRMDRPAFADSGASVRTLDPDEIDAGLDRFFETHRLRWRKRGLPGAFVGRRIQAFHREWAALAGPRGWIWLSVLEVDGSVAGTLYAMRLADTCYFYQAGFDPAHQALSPGTVLVGHTVRRAIEQGIRRFDFLRGDEPYKRRWRPQHAYDNLRFLQAKTRLLGQVGRGWNDAGARVESRIRARLEGRGLR